MKMRRLEDLDLKNKKVFLRLDLNVPMKNGKITDDTRITAALPTIKYILERTPKLVVATHIGRPKGERKPELSAKPIGEKLAHYLGMEVICVDDFTSQPPSHILAHIKEGKQIALLENLRYDIGETKSNPELANTLAQGFDLYVNDAFGTVHRADTSVAGMAERFPPERRAAGFLIQKEIEHLSPMLLKPEHPFTVVMGGAKVSDKISVILNLLAKCNYMLIGGAMAYTFLKYKKIGVGLSKTEDDKMDLVEAIFRTAEQRGVKIMLPVDHVGGKSFDPAVAPVAIAHEEIPAELMGLDIGPKTAASYAEIIKQSKTVFWNGPMGVFEWAPFAQGTLAIGKAMAASKARTIIGGGDSVAAVNQAGVADKMTHISTGGGASLEFLEGKMLPGIKVLLDEK
jgi:phosphoglycerate kinase